MKDPSQGKIYKIVCDETGDVYYGSTTLPTVEGRLKQHEDNYFSMLKGNYPKIPVFNIIELGSYHIELVKDFPCETIFELEREEGNIILANECINVNVPGRTEEEKRLRKHQLIKHIKRVLSARKYWKKRGNTTKTTKKLSLKRIKLLGPTTQRKSRQ